MNHKRQPVKQAIKEFYTSKTLSDTQQKSLHTLQNSLLSPQNDTNSTRHSTLQRLASIAASLLLFIIVVGYAHTPDVITAAFADTLIDADLNNGMQSSMHQWLSENRIAGVPTQYPVEMSKFCKLDQYNTTHLRIAGVEQGMMHLFFHHGDRPMYWFNRAGTVDNMNWKLIEVRNNLTLVVLYTKDMRESTIQNILGEMLPELQA